MRCNIYFVFDFNFFFDFSILKELGVSCRIANLTSANKMASILLGVGSISTRNISF